MSTLISRRGLVVTSKLALASEQVREYRTHRRHAAADDDHEEFGSGPDVQVVCLPCEESESVTTERKR